MPTKVLREHALIESAGSSNRIEGVEVDKSRIATIVFGRPLLRDRDEEEVRGYRQALTLIHEQGAKLPVSEKTILTLHRLTRGEIWDAGKYKEKDGDIIEKFPDGRSRVRFKTVSTANTPICMKELVELYDDTISIAELQNAYPNVSVDMIRRVLKNLRAENRVECLGRGQNARWCKTGK